MICVNPIITKIKSQMFCSVLIYYGTSMAVVWKVFTSLTPLHLGWKWPHSLKLLVVRYTRCNSENIDRRTFLKFEQFESLNPSLVGTFSISCVMKFCKSITFTEFVKFVKVLNTLLVNCFCWYQEAFIFLYIVKYSRK